MLCAGRYRYVLIGVIVVVGTVVILQAPFFGGDSNANAARYFQKKALSGYFVDSKTSSKETPLSTSLKSYEQLHEVSHDESLRRRGIIMGRPSTPSPSPRSPLNALGQPTPSYVTWSMKPLHFLHNKFMKNADEILSAAWVAKLKNMLDMPGRGKQVSVVFANSDYLESVLNWLIAAKVRLQPPLTDVIVFCLDEEVFSVLDQRDIPSVLIDPDTVANLTMLQQIHYKYTVWIVRFIVYRLVNYFGHDVVSYDSDAMVLRNPQEIFQQHQYSDIVSSAGRFPFTLSRVWGFTACMGVILFRSTPKTELLWESVDGNSYDDQMLLNLAFNNCHIQWQSKEKNIRKESIDGQCANGLRVTVLSHANICRYGCTRVPSKGSKKESNQKLYVWHLQSKKMGTIKTLTAKQGNVWYLRRDWRRVDSGTNRSLKGIEWLRSLAVS